jgi:DNA primase
MIAQETIEQVRTSSDIVDIIGLYVRLKKRGRNFLALCPFHNEKTPSFTVSPEKQVYHCFGCGVGGNVFTFLMEHEKMSFAEAVRFLAQRLNIPVRETRSDRDRDEMDRLYYAHRVAVEYYRDLLKLPRYRKPVLEQYLKGRRGITDESIEQFSLGLAGESWEGLVKHAAGKDLKPQDLVKAGLAIHSEQKDSYFDRFRQRLMIPIFNLSQKPIAFGGRTLKKGEPAKYVNSPETDLYSKGNVLYGLNFARDRIRESGSVYVVEGYFDVISLWQAGVQNVVASSGTAFTPQQARLLARFAQEVYLFFDADSAGQRAALRSVDALYDAGLEVKIVVGPVGEDPDSLAREHGRERIEALREEAIGFIAYRTRDLQLGKAGIIAKEKLIKEIKAVGEKIADPTRRALFFGEAADALGVDSGLFRTSPKAAAASAPEESATRDRSAALEQGLLSLLLSNPDYAETVFETLAPADFESDAARRIYTAMIALHNESSSLDTNSLVGKMADPKAAAIVTGLATREWEPERIEAETRQHARQILDRKRRQLIDRLTQEMKEAEEAGDQERAGKIMDEIKAHSR